MMKKKSVWIIIACAALSAVLIAFLIWDGQKESASADSSSTTTSESAIKSVSVKYTDADLKTDWDDSATVISCSGSSVTITGKGASESGGVITITSGGTFVFSGNISHF